MLGLAESKSILSLSVQLPSSHMPNRIFSNCAGIHLRLGDKANKIQYVIPKINYYREALKHINHINTVLVFSDDTATAKEIFGNSEREYIFINNNKDYEDLYLMTRCHDFICSGSTFGWWGAYLNNYPDKTIVAPREWLRPGQIYQKSGLRCKEWISIKNCRFLIDDYRFLMGIEVFKQMLTNIRNKDFDLRLSKIIKMVKKRNYHS